MAKRQTNWEKLQSKEIDERTQYHDVYSDQQLDRTHLMGKQSEAFFGILNAALTIVVFLLSYVVVGICLGAASVLYNYDNGAHSFSYYVAHFSFSRLLICTLFSAGFYAFMRVALKHKQDTQDATRDGSDINQYQNDQHIALPEELQTKFDWFPDAGATSDVQFSSIIAHVAISPKGIDDVEVARRAGRDFKDADGDVVLYKDEILYDENGDMVCDSKPMIDVDFMHALFDASGLPLRNKDGHELRKFWDTRQISYNPGNENREKLKGYDTVADLINGDWQLPYYEPQRPGGAYLVDTAPVNTLVLAIKSGHGVINA